LARLKYPSAQVFAGMLEYPLKMDPTSVLGPVMVEVALLYLIKSRLILGELVLPPFIQNWMPVSLAGLMQAEQ